MSIFSIIVFLVINKQKNKAYISMIYGDDIKEYEI